MRGGRGGNKRELSQNLHKQSQTFRTHDTSNFFLTSSLYSRNAECSSHFSMYLSLSRPYKLN